MVELEFEPQEHLDDKILRFYCCWDDTKRMFGQKLPFALHYYLRWGRGHTMIVKQCES